MKKFIYFLNFVIFLALGALIYYMREADAKSEVLSHMDVLSGVTTYGASPEFYYEKTIINSYNPEPLWSPGAPFGISDQPVISGESGLLVDLNTGRVLFEKNSSKKLKIASLTKIMTAIVALEHKDINSKIYVTRTAAYVGENTMYLTNGEIYTLKELLLGLMLNSGNDAAYAIAHGVAGDTQTFVKWMNLKAEELGLQNTVFADPSGLDDGNESTAQDLVKLSRYAMKNPIFAEIVKTQTAELESETHKYVFLENQTNLLSTYPGVEGIKTGYTEAAGLCLVTYANYEGNRVIGAVLKSNDRKGDMILMLNHGFGSLGYEEPYTIEY